MGNSVRLFVGVLFSAALATAAGAQEPRRQPQMPATGAEDAVQLTPEQLQGLRTLEAMTSRSIEGLTFEHRDDGTIGLNLEGRFQNVLRWTAGADGKLELACHIGGDHRNESAAPSATFSPLRTSQRQRVQAPSRLAAPFRVAPAKAAAPEVK
jgi:hypothetical protein